MIDFNTAERLANRYLGSERKATIRYNGEVYMLKFPDPVRAKKTRALLSYKNNQYSEHIGSSVFRACGITAQETTMGYFTDASGKNKVVVACKDFTQNGGVLYEMSKLANDSVEIDDKLGTRIEDVYKVIDNTHLPINKASIIASFWDMFVIDALIGNKDRHFGNWGLLETHGNYEFSPIYDCGSSLAALLDDESMSELLNHPTIMKSKEYSIHPAYSIHDARLAYHEIIKSPPDDLKDAIMRVVPRINMTNINNIVDNTPTLSQVRRTYLKMAMDLRYTQIIAPAHKALIKKANKNDATVHQ